MTHQLLIRSPFNEKTEKWLQKVNYHYIQKFNACWVVDREGAENLAGELSHPAKMPANNVRYLGSLSRFTYRDEVRQKYDLLILISGPEPQRTLFEDIMLKQIKTICLNALIVSGQPGQPFVRTITDTIKQVNHLNSAALNEAMLQSGLVICRSGYTSVMDLIRLKKKAILIPTPGQTEQEYLSRYLAEKGYFLSFPQEGFNLKEALEKVNEYTFQPYPDVMNHYKEVIRELVDSII
jgi:predicted glycosyltransferase